MKTSQVSLIVHSRIVHTNHSVGKYKVRLIGSILILLLNVSLIAWDSLISGANVQTATSPNYAVETPATLHLDAQQYVADLKNKS